MKEFKLMNKLDKFLAYFLKVSGILLIFVIVPSGIIKNLNNLTVLTSYILLFIFSTGIALFLAGLNEFKNEKIKILNNEIKELKNERRI